MSDFGLSGGWVLTDSAGVNSASSTADTFSVGGSNTKGSWTELIASTSAVSDYIIVTLDHDDSGIEEFLIDIGVGGSGSEQVIVGNLPWSGRQDASHSPLYYALPIRVPSGSRVAVRGQGTQARSLKCTLQLFGLGSKGLSGFTSAKAYGVSTATSRGITVDPGGTANTKGSYTELESSTAETIKGFGVMIGNNDNAIINANSSMLFDIAIGGSGSEQNIVSDLWMKTSTSESNNPIIFYDITIPEGTRVSSRFQSTDTDATDRIRTVTLIGIN